jgi:hypothetical protein
MLPTRAWRGFESGIGSFCEGDHADHCKGSTWPLAIVSTGVSTNRIQVSWAAAALDRVPLAESAVVLADWIRWGARRGAFCCGCLAASAG